jgi:hypothetical protein
VQQFNRNIELIVGDTSVQTGETERRGTRMNSETGILSTLPCLNISFNVKKFLKQSKEGSNSCSVDVYNLSEQTRNKFRSEDNFMQLKVGYGDTNEVIYCGYIDFIGTKFPAPDTITTLEAHNLTAAETDISLSYKENTGAKSILNSVVDQIGIPIHSDGGLSNILDSSFTQGFTFSGKASDALDKLTEKLDVDWSIQNNVVRFSSRKNPPKKSAILITPETGLIGSPEPKYEVDKVKKTKTNPNPSPISGWVVNMLLRPSVEPGDLISVESAVIAPNSFFKVLTVEHSGEYMGTNWNTRVELVDVDVSFKQDNSSVA